MGEVDLVSVKGTPEGCCMISGGARTSPELEAVQQAMANSGGRRKPMSPRGSKQFQEAGQLPSAGNAKALQATPSWSPYRTAGAGQERCVAEELIDVADMAMKIWLEEREGVTCRKSLHGNARFRITAEARNRPRTWPRKRTALGRFEFIGPMPALSVSRSLGLARRHSGVNLTLQPNAALCFLRAIRQRSGFGGAGYYRMPTQISGYDIIAS